MEETKSNPLVNPGHPMLRGGRRSFYKHGFSRAQMETLSAICDTVIPSVSPENVEKPIDTEVESFYLLSGSQNGVPRQVAELIGRWIKLDGRILTWCVLWLLATRLGTLILCGSPSLKREFPFVQSFAEIPQPKREKILLAWSKGSRSSLMNFAFKLFKICCLFAFYTWADENAQNPSWKAIGYSPPEPQKNANPDAGRRPLEKGVVDLSSQTKGIPSMLEGTGFAAAEQVIDGVKAWRVECDAVIVGSGSGGGVAAAVLAKAGYRVIVLEKGKYYAREDFSLLEGPSMDQMYDSGGIMCTNDCKVLILAGSTVGGGSAVNWAASIRTPPHVLKEWAKQHDLPLFESQEYQNAMNVVCERLGVQDACRKESFQNAILRNGCAKLGYNLERVPRNASPDHFCGSCCFGCRTGDKKGTDETWLVDAARANALILAGCKAEKVILEPNAQTGARKKNRKAVGVVAKIGEGQDRIFVQAKLTVAACGSLQTPPLLRASGLRNPNIGRNLHLHPVKMAWGYFPEGNNNSPEGKSYEGGIITAICKEGALSAQSGYGTIIQTPSLMPGSFSAMIPWTSGADMKDRMRRYDRTAHVFVLARDRGSGTVSKEKDIKYKLADSDEQNLAEGLKRALRILIAAGATEVGTHRSDGARLRLEGTTGDDIEKFISASGNTSRSAWPILCSAHQMGSCRMGRDEKTSAVDGNGETWDVQGLFVCDGSVLPTAVGVNPMITIQSTALCISKSMLHFLRKISPPSPPSSSPPSPYD